ncbi:MAG: hypothetical protein INF44_05500, partial [Thalassospira sp.]|nr:hypothetical protein [Thalassospira sp.]
GQPGVGNLPVADFFLTATGTRLFHREGNDLVVDKDNEKEMDVWGFPHDLIRDEIATFGDHYKINISGYDPQAKYGHAYKINMNNAEDRQIQFLLYEILPRMKAHLNDSLKRKNSSQRLSVLSFHANTSEILFGVVPDVRSNKIRLLKQRIKEKNPKFVDDDNTPLVFCGNRRNDFPVLIEEVDVPFGFVRSSSGYERAQAIALKKKFRADPASAPVILSHNPYSLGVIEVLLAVLPQEQQIHAVNCLRETRRRLPEFADLADTSILPREFRRLSDDIGFNNLTIEAMRNYFSSNSSR